MLTVRDLKPELGPNIVQAIKAQMRLEYRVAIQNPSWRNTWYSEALQHVAAARFAALNGWRLARQFAPTELGRRGTDYRSSGSGCTLLDHPVWFAAGRRNIAIVSQPYGVPKDTTVLDEFRRCAELAGLAAHVPHNSRASFWNPGATLFLVLTLPGICVHWLPEQEECES